MNRPMFKMGGSTTPRKNYGYGSEDYNLFGDEGLLSKRDAMYNDLSDKMLKQKQSIASQALAGIDFSSIDKPSDILGVLGDNKDRFGKGLMQQASVDLSMDKMNLNRITSDIGVGTALRKASQKEYEYERKLRQYDENTEAQAKMLASVPQDQGSINQVKSSSAYQNLARKNNFLLREMSELEYILKKDIAAGEDGVDIDDTRKRYRGITGDEKIFKASGGRVDRQMGTPMMGEQPMQQEAQMIEQPMQQENQMAQAAVQQEGQEDPYKYLRDRLPPEIPDPVVRLIAYNKEAFNDFASIEAQDDVDQFNQKYNVELVVNV